MQRNGVSSVFEIVSRVQIGNNPRLNRSPSQPFLSQCTGSCAVDAKEASDPAKVIGCCFGRFADDGYVQSMADRLSDLSSRYALIGDAVICGCSSAFLKDEPKKTSRSDLEQRLFTCIAGEPTGRHLVYADSTKQSWQRNFSKFDTARPSYNCRECSTDEKLVDHNARGSGESKRSGFSLFAESIVGLLYDFLDFL
jgi:hypothetical protein